MTLWRVSLAVSLAESMVAFAVLFLGVYPPKYCLGWKMARRLSCLLFREIWLLINLGKTCLSFIQELDGRFPRIKTVVIHASQAHRTRFLLMST
ncbi:hypothetical protein QL093DRAFT_1461652 [Fusarium oxysporum]|nr:hypothetical protein QL093DRAFT_1461652 [Fusarium oxysporum]